MSISTLDKIQQIEFSLLEEIIKRDNLKLEDEDSLLQIILAKYKENHSSSVLFEYVRFSEISQPLMDEFVKNFNIEHLNTGTFRNICNSLYSLKNNEKPKLERYLSKFLPTKSNEINGIFKYLTEKTGGNIQENGTIKITSNSIGAGDLKNLVDFQNNNYFKFKDISDSTICFDLKDKQIQITNYSIKSYADSTNGDHLKSWVLEVSNDEKNWRKIDEHTNDSHLNGEYVIATFDTNKIEDFYQFIRLKQTGRNWHGDGHFHTEFVFIEFYGKLRNRSEF